MKRTRVLSLVVSVTLLLGLLAVPALAAGGNLLADPYFDGDIGEGNVWRPISGTATITKSTVTPNKFGSSVMVKYPGYSSRYDGVIQDCEPVTTSGYYELSVYVKGSTEGMAALCMLDGKSGRADYVSTQWTKISYVGTLTAGRPFKAEFRMMNTFDSAQYVMFAQPELKVWQDTSVPNYGNLLQNSSFENNFASWSVKGSSSGITIDNYVGYTGNRSLKYNFQSESQRGYVEQTVAAPEAGTYTFSASMKNAKGLNENVQVILYIQAKDSNGNIVASNYKSAMPGSNWTDAEVSVVAPSSAKSITVQIQMGGVMGAFNVDDCALLYSR